METNLSIEKQLKDFISLFVLTPYVQILGFDIKDFNITQTLNNIARDYQAQISLLNNNSQNNLIIGKKLHMWGMD